MFDREIRVSLPVGDDGMAGRQCPANDCRRYFKVKFGTGPDTTVMACPYCETSGGFEDFMTNDQLEYMKSIAAKEVLEPLLRDFGRGLERLNRGHHDSLISLHFEVKQPTFTIRRYSEQDVETGVECDNCQLEFSVFGVFASCPDCGELNAFRVLDSSLESCRKRLALAEREEQTGDAAFARELMEDSLGAIVKAWDGLGKYLRNQRPDVFPQRPPNLFQNYRALDAALSANTNVDIGQLLGDDSARDLMRLLQVRHILEHNSGVVDEQFTKNVPEMSHLIGRKYPLEHQDVLKLLDLIRALAASLERELFSSQTSNDVL